MASVIIILECVSYKKTSIPCIVLYEERKWNEGTVYSSPGGSKDASETFLEAAIRETEEEAFLKVPEELLIQNGGREGLVIGTTHFWVVKLPSVNRETYIRARFCNENLKKYQKETHDLTKVPILSFKKAVASKLRHVVDLGGRRIKLRSAFYKCLIADDNKLIKKIDQVFKKFPC